MPNPIKLKARVTSVQLYGIGVYAVKLMPTKTCPRFKPGQFLHLTIDEYDPAGGFWPESRVFSIASAPGIDEIEIVYSVKGRYTKLMEKRIKPGIDVWIKLPYGNFIIDSSIDALQDVVLVAGGTGISPFLPYLEKISSSGSRGRTIHLYYGIRENMMIIGIDLLTRCIKTGRINLFVFIENEEPAFGKIPGALFARGCIDFNRIYEESIALCNPIYFLSGPPMMIKTFEEKLNAAGVKRENIKIDEWE